MLVFPDSNKLKEITEAYKAHIRFAAHLRCSVVGTETGIPNTDNSFTEEARSAKNLSEFIKNLTPVVRYAESMGVLFAIEPVWKHTVYSPERARAVLDNIGSPNLRIIFDPVNLIDPRHPSERDDIIDRTIELLGKDIAVIHLKDYLMENGEMKCMACGLGEMDYTKVIRFAEERKPFIQATLENTKPDNAEAARKYVEEIASRYSYMGK
ncbi:MAG: TIM barrel protein [Catonella sp.]|nr:TIM barrel protein [Catonella sp.]MDY6357693.1 TIM barrel protein [Catonella sp.]